MSCTIYLHARTLSRCAISNLEKTGGQWSLIFADRQIARLDSQDSLTPIALQLHRMGADNAFSRIAGDQFNPELQEAKYRVAWRAGNWSSASGHQATSGLLDIDFREISTQEKLARHSGAALYLQAAEMPDGKYASYTLFTFTIQMN